MRTPRDPIYAGHRYPAEIISYAVWLYFRFPLSLRLVGQLDGSEGNEGGQSFREVLEILGETLRLHNPRRCR
jgi:hypothetical protein